VVLPGRLPWGYYWRQATEDERRDGAPQKVLDVDPERAPYFREACQRMLASPSVRGVALWIQSLPEDARGGRHFDRTAVTNMLRAPVYIARAKGEDPDVLGRPRGRWPALVDDATWTTIQERIGSHVHMPHQASRRYLLTGLVRCPICGSRMDGHTYTGWRTTRRYASYVCGYKSRGAEVSQRRCQLTVPLPKVDAAVLAEVGRILAAVVPLDGALYDSLARAGGAFPSPTTARTSTAFAGTSSARRPGHAIG